MLAIRMQRTGRKGHAMFRVVVQDSRRTPTSGKIVAQLGSYDPHTKTAQLVKDKASFYLEHGAQPSDRAARLLKSEGVKLPKWVSLEGKKSGAIKNPDKLRRNRPAGTKASAAEAIEPMTTEPAKPTAETPVAPAEPAPETKETEAASEVTQAETGTSPDPKDKAGAEPEANATETEKS